MFTNKGLRCGIGIHRWNIVEAHKATWTTGTVTRDVEVRYRQCSRCQQWQREVFTSGRFENVSAPYETEPDLGSPYFD